MSTSAKRTASGSVKDPSRSSTKKSSKDSEGFLIFKREHKELDKKIKVADIRSKWEELSPTLKQVNT
jgi:hypothetical protein